MCANYEEPSMAHKNDEEWLEWIGDTGASIHVTNDIEDFVEYVLITPVSIATAKKSQGGLQAVGQGAVIMEHYVETQDGKLTIAISRFYPVYYVPGLHRRLFSIGTMIQMGYECRGTQDSIGLYEGNLQRLRFIPERGNQTIYILRTWRTEKATLQALRTIQTKDYNLMHCCLGHPSKEVLRKALKHTRGFSGGVLFPTNNPLCKGCAKDKMHSKSFLLSHKRSKQPFDRIHSDLKEFPTLLYHKYKWFMSFYDDHSSYGWVVLLQRKSNATDVIGNFYMMVKNQYKTDIIEWMFDGGGEFDSKRLDTFMKEKGIVVRQSAPYTPQQNRRAERFNRTIMDKAEAMCHESCAPDLWWEYSVTYAVHIYNQTPSHYLNWQTPYELVKGEKPDISHLRVFGCSAYVYLPNVIRKNSLSPKSELMVFIGITEGIKGYKFMRQANNTEFTATTALFDETMFPKCLKAEWRVYTRIDENHARDNPEKDKIQQIPSEDDNLLYSSSKNDKKDEENHCDNDEDDTNTPGAYEEPPASCQPTPNLNEGQEHQNVPSPTEYRECPRRVRSHVTHPGNVYGETRSPIDIEKEIR